MLRIDTSELKALEDDLKTVSKRAIPYAMRDALNGFAFAARREWSDGIKRTFTTRNKFTAGRALEVEKARSLRVDSMVAVLGSKEQYLAKQEFGGVTSGPIPGPTAAGQPSGSRRTKPVRMGNRLKALAAAKSRGGKSRRQRNAMALSIARRRGQRHAILDRPNGEKGLFRLSGGKRRIKTRLVWALGHGPTRVKPSPTLGPAVRRTEQQLESLHRKALLKQLRLHHVFGY